MRDGLVRRVAVLAAAALMMSGCAAAGASRASGPISTSSRAAPPTLAAPAPSGSASTGAPPTAAAMVCGQEIRGQISQILGLPAAPVPASAWSDGLYTCTYGLPAGTLVLSVKESADPAGARSWAQGAVRAQPGAAPIEGLANLGLEGYRAGTGTVVFVKDSFTLTVDATGMHEPLGPEGISRSSLAYQIATDVLACWSE